MQNRRLILTAGFSGHETEFGLTGAERESVELRNLISQNLKERGIEVINDSCQECVSNPIKWLDSNLSQRDLLINFHFGKSDIKGVEGTEAYVSNPNEDVRKVSKILNSTTADILHVIPRGITQLAYSNYPKKRILHNVKCDALLWQVCFLSSVEDMKKYKESKMELVNRISEKLQEFLFGKKLASVA